MEPVGLCDSRFLCNKPHLSDELLGVDDTGAVPVTVQALRADLGTFPPCLLQALSDRPHTIPLARPVA